MSNESITYLVAACCGVFASPPTSGSSWCPPGTPTRALWERVAAAFLSLYVLLAFVGLGSSAAPRSSGSGTESPAETGA